MNLESSLARRSPSVTSLVDRLIELANSRPDDIAFTSWDGTDIEASLTYSELCRHAQAVAAELQARNEAGARVLLLFPPGLSFVSAFLGCLFAGAAAVPALPPRRNRTLTRIQAISEDAQASVVLTVREVMERAEALLDETPKLKQLQWLTSEEIDVAGASDWQRPELADTTLAVVQYTSGSTGQPKGVMLSHANLVRNCELINHGFETPGGTGSGLSWLPTYHDMGLVGGVLKPLWRGRPNVLMPPMAFLQKPVRWLRGISHFRTTVSGGPNFAYALCNDKIAPEECEGLDLSCWEVAFNGAEPVRAETLERFTEKFAPFGFRAEAHYPCYGMAETTLIVTGGKKKDRPIVRAFETTALEHGRVEPLEEPQTDRRRLVGCGRPLPGMTLKIVDPESRQPLPENRVGEIWVRGPSVGLGYWSKPEEAACTFGARLANGCREAYLRTGDLGFVNDGELFVTGRCKDVIIIHGRNLHPHDIELTVEQAHPALRPGSGAAFSVDCDGEERLIVAQEIERQYRGIPPRDHLGDPQGGLGNTRHRAPGRVPAPNRQTSENVQRQDTAAGLQGALRRRETGCDCQVGPPSRRRRDGGTEQHQASLPFHGRRPCRRHRI